MSLKFTHCCANRRGIYDVLLALNSNSTSIFNNSWDITPSLLIHTPPLFQVEPERQLVSGCPKHWTIQPHVHRMITVHARPKQTDKYHGNSAMIRSNECIACWKLITYIKLNLHGVSKNDTDVAHYNFDADEAILIILVEMLMREYAIKQWFVIPSLLTNVSALPGETWKPEMVSLQSYYIPCVENQMARLKITLAHCT